LFIISSVNRFGKSIRDLPNRATIFVHGGVTHHVVSSEKTLSLSFLQGQVPLQIAHFFRGAGQFVAELGSGDVDERLRSLANGPAV
jgi:hypothetical protein